MLLTACPVIARRLSHVTCLGRTGRGPAVAAIAAAAAVEGSGCMVQFCAVDLGAAEDIGYAAACAAESAPLQSVLHAGGALADALLQRQTLSAARTVFAPKARGGALLARVTARLPVAGLQLFSSMSGALGNGGQANYAAANAALDKLASQLQVSTRRQFALTILVQRRCSDLCS